MDRIELRPKLDFETCAVCGRTLLLGEHFERFIAPDGSRNAVCELCTPRATRARWIRETAADDTPAPRAPATPRTGLLARIRSTFENRGESSTRRGGEREAKRSRPATPPMQKRDVRAVPTTAEVKIERGIELFNGSQFPRTIAGLTRSLGQPQVAVWIESPAVVAIVVAWDITWYEYAVDLADINDPAALTSRGTDMVELGERVTQWNIQAGADGHLTPPAATREA